MANWSICWMWVRSRISSRNYCSSRRDCQRRLKQSSRLRKNNRGTPYVFRDARGGWSTWFPVAWPWHAGPRSVYSALMMHSMPLRNPAPPISTATVRERPVAPEDGASLRAMMHIPVSSSRSLQEPEQAIADEVLVTGGVQRHARFLSKQTTRSRPDARDSIRTHRQPDPSFRSRKQDQNEMRGAKRAKKDTKRSHAKVTL